MLRDLRITNFRGLRAFAMSGLGRVNLLVGTNNCGKTSVLEALHMLSSPGTVVPLWLAQIRRGESVETTSEVQIDVAHVVHGHVLAEGMGFQIMGEGTSEQQQLIASFTPRELGEKDVVGEGDTEDLFVPSGSGALAPLSLRLQWTGGSSPNELRLPLTRWGRFRDRDYRPHYLAVS